MSAQQSIGSAFTAASTAREVLAGVDLTGRTAMVTGGASGLGLQTTLALAAAGAQVVVPVRDSQKAGAALAGVTGVELASLDLADRGSIADFAGGFVQSGRALDMLINSAGVMATPLFRDADGHEGQFATNHLGHFRLTMALLPALRRAGGARVVSVSSRGHQIAGMDFDDVDFERRPYDKWQAYGQSKTANVLFALEFDRRFQGDGIRAFALHPGQVITALSRHLSDQEMAGFDAFDAEGQPRIEPDKGMKTPEQGAATSVWAATSRLLDGLGGVYLEDCEVAAVNRAEVGRRGVAAWAVDPVAAARLWALSERLA